MSFVALAATEADVRDANTPSIPKFHAKLVTRATWVVSRKASARKSRIGMMICS